MTIIVDTQHRFRPSTRVDVDLLIRWSLMSSGESPGGRSLGKCR